MKLLKKLYDWKIAIIRKYPVACAIIAWLEGIIIGIFVVLLVIGLSGCGVKQINTLETEAPTVLESVGKMEGIGMALGCMFIPEACQDFVNKDEQ